MREPCHSAAWPSGCGKSTTLSLIAEIFLPDRGRIVLDGEVLTDTIGVSVPMERRGIGWVFRTGGCSRT
jgi:molybdate transport system ATP-binding protein